MLAIINNRSVEILESIEDLPIYRFHKFNKYMLIDAGIGSDLNDLQTRANKAKSFISNNKPKEAQTELTNLLTAFSSIASELNYGHLAFMFLIESVDGVKITDYSDSGVRKTLALVNGEPLNRFNALFSAVKKKLMMSLKHTFRLWFKQRWLKLFTAR
jgi:hypothetical protein